MGLGDAFGDQAAGRPVLPLDLADGAEDAAADVGPERRGPPVRAVAGREGDGRAAVPIDRRHDRADDPAGRLIGPDVEGSVAAIGPDGR
jgi:hypothetical protein